MLASMRRITVYWSSGARQGPAASLRFVDGVDGINRGLQFPSSTIQRAGIESGIVDVGPFSPFPMRTKMRLKLLAAGRPTAISPAGFESPKARPPATHSQPCPSRSVSRLARPKCLNFQTQEVHCRSSQTRYGAKPQRTPSPGAKRQSKANFRRRPPGCRPTPSRLNLNAYAWPASPRNLNLSITPDGSPNSAVAGLIGKDYGQAAGG
jgi:hypothetical protein